MYVTEFVREHTLKIDSIQLSHQRLWQRDDRTYVADHARAIDVLRRADRDRAGCEAARCEDVGIVQPDETSLDPSQSRKADAEA